MASTKIKVVLKQDDETGTDSAMFQPFKILLDLGVIPLRQVTLALECLDQDSAQLRDDIAVALTDRPAGIAVTIERKTKEEIERRRMTVITHRPMDSLWGVVPQKQPIPQEDLPEPPAGSAVYVSAVGVGDLEEQVDARDRALDEAEEEARLIRDERA